ncbi:hypothetical protein BDP27DRAFT_75064 [Rhodocollybia butyracea]|uniref:Uncharacterized protein n=1 Tax=Rhodocollybia butyracea TaxID=206335 RepID=A0A9P5PL04_9AGAR|nr:hypothetical protein BDP27DRAFT_75064 [Rhodocollybia butyracea]
MYVCSPTIRGSCCSRHLTRLHILSFALPFLVVPSNAQIPFFVLQCLVTLGIGKRANVTVESGIILLSRSEPNLTRELCQILPAYVRDFDTTEGLI